MQQISAGQFKAKCLKIMDEVLKSHEEIVVTKFKKPIVRILPFDSENQTKRALFGFLKHTVIIRGDIVKSIGEPWNADEKKAV